MACRFRSAAIMGRRSGRSGAGGLTRLSAWWIKLGVEPHFIHPASPQENGRHERMHRTLKAETSRPAGGERGRTAGPLRRLPPALQPGAPARSARPDDRRPNSTRHRSDPCRIALRTLGTTPITRSAACAPSGEIMWNDERRLRQRGTGSANSWASPNSRPATMSCASTTATWGSSIAVAASPGSLRPVRGSANRPNRPQTQKCRVSSRSKVSTINPVEPVGGHISCNNHYPPPPALPHKGGGSRPPLPLELLRPPPQLPTTATPTTAAPDTGLWLTR